MRKAFAGFALGLCLLAAGCGGQSGVRVLKLGHGLDVTHPVHKAMLYMAERLAEKSGGKVTLEVYPGEQLGSERECLELVQLGILDITKSSTAPVESFVPVMGVFSVPYIFRDETHFWNVLHGEIGQELLKSGVDVGLRGLCYYDSGARSFYTIDKPVRTPADLKDMNVRVMQSKTSIDMVNALGANPIAIDWGELYTSLQQGRVTGAENNPPSFHLSHHFEVCKYYSLDEHSRIPDILLMSEEVWQTLSAETQAMVLEAAAESEAYQRELWREMVQESYRVVKEAGVEIIHPDKSTFREKVADMHASYKGTEVGDLIDRIQAVQ